MAASVKPACTSAASLLGGFSLRAYAATENFLPLSEPSWWHPLLFPSLVALGSLAFGAGVFRARALPRGALALVGVFGLVGMALLPIAESPPLRLAGFAAMLAFGGGWVWLGYACGGPWRRARSPADKPVFSPSRSRPNLC